MKIIVKSEIGREKNAFDPEEEKLGWIRNDYTDFEQSVTTYPAPGIADGEHEATLVWEQSDEDGEGKTIWKRCYNPLLATSDTRQIYRLSPSLKEAEVKSPEQQLLDQPKEQVIERQFKNNCDYGFKQRNVNAFIRLAFESGFENGMNYQKYSNHPDTK